MASSSTATEGSVAVGPTIFLGHSWLQVVESPTLVGHLVVTVGGGSWVQLDRYFSQNKGPKVIFKTLFINK